MTYQNISKNGVDTAPPLEFAARNARQELTITIHATIDGFPTEICFSGALDQLEAITRRLRDLGASPAGVHQLAPAAPVQATPARKPSGRVEPVYQPDGTACCPIHRKPLSEGRYGLFCPSRATGDQAANDKGYCNIRFAE
jgi:hypothetical protein